jgi:hypothetical protein
VNTVMNLRALKIAENFLNGCTIGSFSEGLSSVRKYRKVFGRPYVISGHYCNELSRVNTLHERQLCSKSRTSEESFVSVYRICSGSINNILAWLRRIMT